MIKQIRTGWLLFATLCILAGCGWQLQGVAQLAPAVQHVYIDTPTPNAPFTFKLKHLLEANKVTVVDTQSSASSTLKLSNLKLDNRITSVIGGGEAGQYTLTASAHFSLIGSGKKVLIPETLVQTSQQYNSNASQALSANSKTQTLSEDMQQQLAESILSQLASYQPKQHETISEPTDNTP